MPVTAGLFQVKLSKSNTATSARRFLSAFLQAEGTSGKYPSFKTDPKIIIFVVDINPLVSTYVADLRQLGLSTPTCREVVFHWACQDWGMVLSAYMCMMV